jgi:hypothetical protein
MLSQPQRFDSLGSLHVGNGQRRLAMHTMQELSKRWSVSLMVHRKFQLYAFLQQRGQLGGAGSGVPRGVRAAEHREDCQPRYTLLSIVF